MFWHMHRSAAEADQSILDRAEGPINVQRSVLKRIYEIVTPFFFLNSC